MSKPLIDEHLRTYADLVGEAQDRAADDVRGLKAEVGRLYSQVVAVERERDKLLRLWAAVLKAAEPTDPDPRTR